MNPPAAPPPLPSSAGRNRLWILLTTLAVIGVLALVAAGVMAVSAFRRLQEKKAATRAAFGEFEKNAEKERSKMADLIEDGSATGHEAALGRAKELLEKSADQLGGDGNVARAMANFLGKIQAPVHEYEAVVARLNAADVFSFHPRDKAMLETHRQMVRDFLACNARCTATMTGADELLRAELDAAKVPAKAREEAVRAATRSQQVTRPLQIQIRQCDQTVGETALAVLDLLEKEWGRWRYDEAAKTVRFEDQATLSAHDVLIKKIQDASAEQTKAQAEVAAKMRAVNGP